MKLERHDELAVLRMSAGKANAIDPAFLRALDGLLDELEQSDARAAVLVGYEGFFSAGLDLVTLVGFDRNGMRELMSAFERVFLRVFACPLPVVAAMNGHALAGGCVLALQADWRVLSEERAKTGLNEAQLGVGLPPLVIESLRPQLPASSWIPVCLEGGIFDPPRALELGLVDELVPAADVERRAIERAGELARTAGPAWAQIKRAIRGPAIARLEGEREGDLEPWLDTWFADETRARLEAAVEKLTARR